MKWSRLPWGLLLVPVLLTALAAGCTNSDTLNSGTGRVVIRVDLINRSTRFLVAGFTLSQVNLRPIDPNASDALGTNPLGLINTTTTTIDVNFNGTANEFGTLSPVPVGQYRLATMVFRDILFRAGTRTSDTSCVGYVINYPPQRITFTSFPDDLLVSVIPGDNGSEFRMTIDGKALADAFEASWTPTVPPNCARTFSSAAFVGQASTYLQFP